MNALFFADWSLKALPIRTESWLIFTIVLIALIIFIWLVARLVTRVTGDTDPAETDRQMLTAISELHRKGNLTQEEFRSIKGQLVERLRDTGFTPDDLPTTSDPANSADKSDSSVKPDSAQLESETTSGEDSTLAT